MSVSDPFDVRFFNTCVASVGFFLAFSGGPSFLHSAWNNWHLVLFQTAIGADIMMQLDDVVDATHTDPQRFEEARHRTVRWLDRCIEAHKNTSKQNLFPIVQGSQICQWHIVPGTLFEIFIFCPKVLLWFPEKIVNFLGVKNSWKCCGFGLFTCWQLWFHEKNCQKIFWWKTRENVGVLSKLNFWTKIWLFE